MRLAMPQKRDTEQRDSSVALEEYTSFLEKKGITAETEDVAQVTTFLSALIATTENTIIASNEYIRYVKFTSALSSLFGTKPGSCNGGAEK